MRLHLSIQLFYQTTPLIMENVLNQMFLLGLLCPCSCVIVKQGSMDPGLLLCISAHLRLRPSISQQGQYRILMWVRSVPGWTIALQQLNCQVSPSGLPFRVPVECATQLYRTFSEHSCIIKSLMVY